nr:hypothetical protein Iba_chr15aCG6910 [Ipomoea batatas]
MVGSFNCLGPQQTLQNSDQCEDHSLGLAQGSTECRLRPRWPTLAKPADLSGGGPPRGRHRLRKPTLAKTADLDRGPGGRPHSQARSLAMPGLVGLSSRFPPVLWTWFASCCPAPDSRFSPVPAIACDISEGFDSILYATRFRIHALGKGFLQGMKLRVLDNGVEVLQIHALGS